MAGQTFVGLMVKDSNLAFRADYVIIDMLENISLLKWGIGLTVQNDFSRGSVSGNILRLAVPLMLAQLVNVLYNVVDRIFIGHIGGSTLPLTGVGLCMPVITVISAFSDRKSVV